MMNLTLPNKVEHCSPDQLTKWIMLADAIKDNENENRSFVQMIEFQCQVLSIFSGQSVTKIKKGNIDDVQAAANSMLEVLGAYKSSDPIGKVTIEGKNYIFDKDFAHMTTGAIIDLKLIDNVAEDPCRALAICYVEEGLDYCHEDNKGRVVNPTAIRYELFKKHFPGDEFLNYFGFFLHNYEQRKAAILSIQMLRAEMMNKKMIQELKIANGSFGRESFIDYQKNWDAVWMRLQANHI
jgi:hypothetical protein